MTIDTVNTVLRSMGFPLLKEPISLEGGPGEVWDRALERVKVEQGLTDEDLNRLYRAKREDQFRCL